MQKLTARGIRLAGSLRSQGIPVIESYPGAAQDIMRIPRKGAGPEWLKIGLGDFGVSGDYETQNVTHDEARCNYLGSRGHVSSRGNDRSAGNGRGAAPHHPEASEGAAFDRRSESAGPIAAGKTTLARAPGAKGLLLYAFQPGSGRFAGGARASPRPVQPSEARQRDQCIRAPALAERTGRRQGAGRRSDRHRDGLRFRTITPSWWSGSAPASGMSSSMPVRMSAVPGTRTGMVT